MNKLSGEIKEIQTADNLSLVKVYVDGITFTSIVIDTPATNPGLRIGNLVSILFKETEVIIARAPLPAISVQNRMECIIHDIHSGELLCELTLHLVDGMPGGTSGEVGEIRSIITRNACDQLDLRVNDRVIALVKTNEISLLTDD